MKRCFSAMLLITFLLAFSLSFVSGCNGGNYKDDVSVELIHSEIISRVAINDSDSKGYHFADEDFIKYDLKSPDCITDYMVSKSTDSKNINEFGIFRAEDGKAEELKAAIEDYLNKANEAWDTRYLQDQHSKLKDAEVKVCGNYVIYAILSDSDKTTVFNCFEDLLTIK